MDPLGLSIYAEILKASGPYALVAGLSWGFWVINEKKDRELKNLSTKIISMAEAQTRAIMNMESALLALKNTIEQLTSIDSE